MPDLKTSVILRTHNSELTVKAAIASVLMQKVNFNYEIVVCDDGSSDKTPSILMDYKSSHPNCFKILLHEKRMGFLHCALQVLSNCSGNYIAMLDADSIWTYDEKLQRQVDFLDSHSSYKGCFHDAEFTDSETRAEGKKDIWPKYFSQRYRYHDEFFPWDLIDGARLPPGTLLHRKDNIIKVLEEHDEADFDFYWLYHLMVIKHGRFRYLNNRWVAFNESDAFRVAEATPKAIIVEKLRLLNMLLHEEYYRNLKHHVFRALSSETLDEYSLPEAGYSPIARLAMIKRIYCYQQKYLMHRIKSLWQQL